MEDNKVYTTQGTRLEDKAPWETYADEMTERISPDLAAEIEEYSKHRYDEAKSSNESKEELCKQREINQEIAKDYQWLTPEEYDDIEQRIGRVMHSSVFINLLRKAGVQCWYTQHEHPQKATLLIPGRGTNKYEVACWVQQGFMVELSIMNFDDKGVPLDEKRRGWRTCLLQLILKGIISEDKANEVFGKPRQTKAYDRYNSTLYDFRKRTFQTI